MQITFFHASSSAVVVIVTVTLQSRMHELLNFNETAHSMQNGLFIKLNLLHNTLGHDGHDDMTNQTTQTKKLLPVQMHARIAKMHQCFF